jgi:hypothetical protein
MRLIIKDVESPRFGILMASDAHYGNRFCDEWSIKKYVDMIGPQPWGIVYANLIGDICEAKMRNSKGKQSDQIHSPGKQLKYLKELLKDKSEFIDSWVDGNHEQNIANEVEDLNLGEEIVDYLNKDREHQIIYDPEGVFLVYRFNGKDEKKHTNTFSIYARHGSTGAALPGGKLNAAQRGRWNASANVIFTGHVHQFTMAPGEFYDAFLNGPNPSLKSKEQWTVTNGSCLKWGGYGETKGYQAGPIVQTMIYVDLSGHDTQFDITPIRPQGHRWMEAVV